MRTLFLFLLYYEMVQIDLTFQSHVIASAIVFLVTIKVWFNLQSVNDFDVNFLQLQKKNVYLSGCNYAKLIWKIS